MTLPIPRPPVKVSVDVKALRTLIAGLPNDGRDDGPWSPVTGVGMHNWEVRDATGYLVASCPSTFHYRPHFIAAARTALPELLDEIERLTAQVEEDEATKDMYRRNLARCVDSRRNEVTIQLQQELVRQRHEAEKQRDAFQVALVEALISWEQRIDMDDYPDSDSAKADKKRIAELWTIKL